MVNCSFKVVVLKFLSLQFTNICINIILCIKKQQSNEIMKNVLNCLSSQSTKFCFNISFWYKESSNRFFQWFRI